MPTRFSPIFHTASPQTVAISNLFIGVLILCAVILLIVSLIVGIGLMRFRQRKDPGNGGEGGDPPPHFGNLKLEMLWTLGPTLILVCLFALTVRGMRQADPGANQQPDILIIGHQWWWEARYPQNGAVTANEIHIPAGKKCLVRLESADVIHDFWIPELARKIQTIPGHPNYVWLEADAPGKYDGVCAEYCGVQHSWMRFSVVAESSATFSGWLAHQAAPSRPSSTSLSMDSTRLDSAQNGLKLFLSLTCVNCHSIRGVSQASVTTDAAPDLTHFASRKSLGAGALPNTPSDLFNWLKNPQAVKPGCFMPNLKLTDAETAMLVSYLETLK